MGGVVVSSKAQGRLRESSPMFMPGSTFGGHPVASAVALENIAIIEREKLLENVHSLEAYFKAELRRMAENHPIVSDVRGMRFFWAVEIKPERSDGTPLKEYIRYFKGIVSRNLLGGGLIYRFDAKDEPVIQFPPALIAAKQVISRIAEITEVALTDLKHPCRK